MSGYLLRCALVWVIFVAVCTSENLTKKNPEKIFDWFLNGSPNRSKPFDFSKWNNTYSNYDPPSFIEAKNERTRVIGLVMYTCDYFIILDCFNDPDSCEQDEALEKGKHCKDKKVPAFLSTEGAHEELLLVVLSIHGRRIRMALARPGFYKDGNEHLKIAEEREYMFHTDPLQPGCRFNHITVFRFRAVALAACYDRIRLFEHRIICDDNYNLITSLKELDYMIPPEIVPPLKSIYFLFGQVEDRHLPADYRYNDGLSSSRNAPHYFVVFAENCRKKDISCRDRAQKNEGWDAIELGQSRIVSLTNYRHIKTLDHFTELDSDQPLETAFEAKNRYIYQSADMREEMDVNDKSATFKVFKESKRIFLNQKHFHKRMSYPHSRHRITRSGYRFGYTNGIAIFIAVLCVVLAWYYTGSLVLRMRGVLQKKRPTNKTATSQLTRAVVDYSPHYAPDNLSQDAHTPRND